MNIEEALAAIEEAAGCLANGPDCHPSIEAWDDLNAAVRAGFLAVMEKALMVGSADHIDDYDAGAEALRREIEELK